GLGIEPDPEEALHEARRGLLERRDAVVGVAAVLGLVDLRGHGAANQLGRHAVVLADAEIDQRTLGMGGERLALGTLDLLELVDLGALAVAGATDAVGEHGLEVGVAHRHPSSPASTRPERRQTRLVRGATTSIDASPCGAYLSHACPGFAEPSQRWCWQPPSR